MKYFSPPYNPESINKQFKQLAKKFHPDKQGSESDFKALINERDNLLSAIKKHTPIKTKAHKIIIVNNHIDIDQLADKIVNNFLNKIFK